MLEILASIKKLEYILQILQSKSQSKCRRLHLRIQKYENIINSYLHEDFKSHFRMSRNSLELLIRLCETTYNRKLHVGRPDIPFKLQCLICIWVLANQESYRYSTKCFNILLILQCFITVLDFSRSVADRFNVTKSTVFHCLIRVCKIISKRGSAFITWPQDAAALDVIESFRV